MSLFYQFSVFLVYFSGHQVRSGDEESCRLSHSLYGERARGRNGWTGRSWLQPEVRGNFRDSHSEGRRSWHREEHCGRCVGLQQLSVRWFSQNVANSEWPFHSSALLNSNVTSLGRITWYNLVEFLASPLLTSIRFLISLKCFPVYSWKDRNYLKVIVIWCYQICLVFSTKPFLSKKPILFGDCNLDASLTLRTQYQFPFISTHHANLSATTCTTMCRSVSGSLIWGWCVKRTKSWRRPSLRKQTSSGFLV